MLHAQALHFQHPSLTLTLVPAEEGEAETDGEAQPLSDSWFITLSAGDSDGPLRFAPEEPPPARAVQFLEQTPYVAHVAGEVERRRFDLRLNGQPGWFKSYSRGDARNFSGTINWGNFVGWSRLEVVLDGEVVGDLPVEVRSKKLDYRADFRRMLDDLGAQLATLVFDAFRPTALPTEWREPGPRTAYLDYLLLRHLFAPLRLPAAFARITQEPHRQARREWVWREPGQVAHVGPRTVEVLVAEPERLAPAPPGRTPLPGLPAALGGRVPMEVLTDRPVLTFDTPENRFVKHFLHQLARAVERLVEVFKREGRDDLAQEGRVWLAGLGRWQQAGFLAEVGELRQWPGASPVLAQKDGYRELAAAAQLFWLTGRVQWKDLSDWLAADVRDLATLYEMWCLFQLLAALRDVAGGDVRLRPLFDLDGDAFRVRLRPGEVATAGDGATRLLYQPTYPRGRGSYSVALRPDFAVERGEESLIFDAKYRAETAAEFDSAQEEEMDERTFVRSDLYKMHTYRDALRGARAAFVLYPGDEPRLLAAEDASSGGSGRFQGVGVLPLRPGGTGGVELRDRLREFLNGEGSGR